MWNLYIWCGGVRRCRARIQWTPKRKMNKTCAPQRMKAEDKPHRLHIIYWPNCAVLSLLLLLRRRRRFRRQRLRLTFAVVVHPTTKTTFTHWLMRHPGRSCVQCVRCASLWFIARCVIFSASASAVAVVYFISFFAKRVSHSWFLTAQDEFDRRPFVVEWNTQESFIAFVSAHSFGLSFWWRTVNVAKQLSLDNVLFFALFDRMRRRA